MKNNGAMDIRADGIKVYLKSAGA